MNINELSRLSGLTVGQINQGISRYGLVPHARTAPGQYRQFTSADAFNFMIAGEMVRMGFLWPAIRDAVWAFSAMSQVDTHGFEQLETFPGRSRYTEAILVVTGFDPEKVPSAAFVERQDMSKLGAEPLIALPATRLARLVEAAANE